jgi:hypothetical protein
MGFLEEWRKFKEREPKQKKDINILERAERKLEQERAVADRKHRRNAAKVLGKMLKVKIDPNSFEENTTRFVNNPAEREVRGKPLSVAISEQVFLVRFERERYYPNESEWVVYLLIPDRHSVTAKQIRDLTDVARYAKEK